MLLALQGAFASPYIRALNYHEVPAEHADGFEAQLRFYARHFHFADMNDLLALSEGRWQHDRPGLLLTFDDGLESHATVAAPLLERHGATGWFMVPAAVLDDDDAEPRPHTVMEKTMNWTQLRELDASHVVGCHTFTHCRLDSKLRADQLDHEIPGAKRALEAGLGHEIPVFAWVGGEEWTYSRSAAEAIRAAGFRFGFMTNNAPIRPHTDLLQIQRTNIEAWFEPALVGLSLSGFYDLMYSAKRRRVNRLTRTGSAGFSGLSRG